MNNNENEFGIMIINVENLSFTVPIKIDNTRYLTNVFHKDYDGKLYGILIITPSLEDKKLLFNFFRDVELSKDDERADKAIEIIKNYISKTLKVDGLDLSVGGSLDLTLNMGMDIEKTDGKGNVVEKKHIEVSKKLN